MTREEEIIKASNVYSEYEYNQTDFENGFINGAKWADTHPKTSWISVKERLPPKEKDGLSIKVLVISNNNKITFSRYDYDVEGWISSVLDIVFTHWMPIPELPKE